jgi:hypothetical protein
LGFKRLGSKRAWWLGGPEVQWAVDMEKMRWGLPRFQTDAYADLQGREVSQRPNSYPITVSPADLPPVKARADGWQWMRAVLSLDSGMGDEERMRELDELLGLTAGYIKDHLTTESMVEAYRAGDFRSAVLLREARAFLEAGGGVWPAGWSDRREPEPAPGAPMPGGGTGEVLVGRIGSTDADIAAAVDWLAALAEGRGEELGPG